MNNLSIAISPCPNDTFIFEHFVHSNTLPYKINVDYYDIQTLNKMALQQKYDLIKVSFAMLPYLLDNYTLLKVGSALGEKNGPLLISKNKINIEDIKSKRIISPGEFTTANLLFDYFFPQCKQKIFHVFSEIEDAILKNEADIGIIIHENRFTYQNKGLIKIADLGDLWEQKTQLPIPLGCLLIKKSIPEDIKKDVQNRLQKSILEARKKMATISEYIKLHAQEMEDNVIKQHIQLYVNELTFELNDKAIKAIKTLINQNFPDFNFPDSWILD